MRRYLLLILIIILILYYIFSFLVSFTLLTKSVVNNDPISLKRYINEEGLKNNFFDDLYQFSSNSINLIGKNISIKTDSIEFTGELTPIFLEKLFFRMSDNISSDFSSPEIMLYFYFSSNEISTYLNKYFSHFGDYNFEKYLLQKQLENIEDARNDKAENNKEEEKKEKKHNKEEIKKEDKENILSQLIQRIKHTDYFFLTSPIHFKIDVRHQDIRFILILKFNGYIWKVQKIKIPYKELINLKN